MYQAGFMYNVFWDLLICLQADYLTTWTLYDVSLEYLLSNKMTINLDVFDPLQNTRFDAIWTAASWSLKCVNEGKSKRVQNTSLSWEWWILYFLYLFINNTRTWSILQKKYQKLVSLLKIEVGSFMNFKIRGIQIQRFG